MRIKESDDKIARLIQRECLPHLNHLFSSSVPKIKKIVKKTLENKIRSQPEWNSVVSGVLREHFGLPDGLRRLENIMYVWLDGIKVEFKPMRPKGAEYTGGIKISGITAGYGDVFSFRDSKLITEKGSKLQWLKWLLNEGNKDIILGYQIGFGRGRAGDRIMIKNKAGAWRVPNIYQGTKDNNFIVRAIRKAEPEIQREIENILS